MKITVRLIGGETDEYHARFPVLTAHDLHDETDRLIALYDHHRATWISYPGYHPISHMEFQE